MRETMGYGLWEVIFWCKMTTQKLCDTISYGGLYAGYGLRKGLQETTSYYHGSES